MFNDAYDRFLDAEWDRYCEQWEIKDGEYEADVKLGPLCAKVRYLVSRERPTEVIGFYINAWCPRTHKYEQVEISEWVDYDEKEVLAMVDPEKDKMIRERNPEDEYDGPD